jgi:secreted trypsin-like serine protease
MDPNFSETEISFSSTDGSGACHGDSGGPAFATIKGQKVIVGITSRTTDKSGGCHKDSVYTNVAAYKTLIDQMAAKLQAAQ